MSVGKTTKTIGYGIMVTIGKETEPLSFGRGREPSPEDLLRRARMHVFSTLDDAKSALQETVKRGLAAKAEWCKPGKARFDFVEITKEEAGV